MKVSTEIGSLSSFTGEEKAVEILAKAGFDAFDFSMFEMVKYDWRTGSFTPSQHILGSNHYLDFAKRIKKVADDSGIECNQSHAPFPVKNKFIYDYIKRAIECTAVAGGKICVVHPNNDFTAEQNAEMYQNFLPFAKEHGVKIATENMYNWDRVEDHCIPAACSSPEDFVKHIDTVNDEYFVACLDLGHAEMLGVNTSAVEMIKALGSRIQALHIHDNDKRIDSHQIPFSMNMDFTAIVKALKEINYSGYFTLEADAYLKSLHGITQEEGVKNLYKAVRKLADMFEEL